jgi:putrescine aminotransferase
MTAGFHPLAGVLYPKELDILEQYDAISTNGNASLASLVALCNLRLIARERDRLAEVSKRHEEGLEALAAEFPRLIQEVNGKGFLGGIKFRGRQVALAFHKAAVERGLWLRVHAYHPGHRTILLKYPLVFDEAAVDFVLEVFRELLLSKPWE